MKLHSQRRSDAVTYSLREHGADYRLSENFVLGEFASGDGADTVVVHPVLVDGLQRVRDYFGKSVIVNSGFRTIEHNAAIGGVDDSRHLWGGAGDIVVPGVSRIEVQSHVETMGWGGIGFYYTFTHLDVQGRDRRWGPAL